MQTFTLPFEDAADAVLAQIERATGGRVKPVAFGDYIEERATEFPGDGTWPLVAPIEDVFFLHSWLALLMATSYDRLEDTFIVADLGLVDGPLAWSDLPPWVKEWYDGVQPWLDQKWEEYNNLSED